MSSTPERIVVSNTSPLLYLHQIGHLELLQQLYGQVRIPPAVRMELYAGAQLGISVPNLRSLMWIKEQALAERVLLPVVVDLGSGEAEAIALALASPGSLLILDDRLGRRIARLIRVTCTGTLGVLLKAKQVGLLPSVTPAVTALRDTTMHLTSELIEMVLKEAGEA
jgi:predicted nucleic acid-binding protein